MSQQAVSDPPTGVPSPSTTTTQALRTIHLDNLADCQAASTAPIKLPFSLFPSTWIKRLLQKARRNLLVAVLVWWLSFFRDVILFSLLSPSSIFDDVFDFVASLALYTVIGTGMTVYAIFLTIFNKLGGQGWLETVGETYAADTKLPNWFNPEVVSENTARGAVQQARRFLAGGIPTTVPPAVPDEEDNPAFTSNATTRIFSTVLARALVVLASTVYERSDQEVDDASDVFYQAKQQYNKGAITLDEFNRERRRAEDKLAKSEEKIRKLAAACDLEYDGISDLITVGGPCASIFYTRPGAEEDPFIVLVLKGTMFTYLPEIIVDMSFSRVPTSGIFGGGAGMAHRGFFTSLFKSDSFDYDARLNTGSVGGDGYGSIVQSLRHAAARMQAHRPLAQRQRAIPLWITGHSLGGAMGLLAYGRFLKSPEDLGNNIELRDFYGFGTLRVGDADFANNLESLITTPRNKSTIAWRFDCRVDIAPNFPFGAENRTPTSGSSIFNYCHPGPSLWIRPLCGKEATYKLRNVESLRASTEVKIVTDARGERAVGAHERSRPTSEDSARSVALAQDPENPLRRALWWLGQFIPCVYDHMTWSYFHALNAIGCSDATDPDSDPARRAVVRTSAPAPLALAEEQTTGAAAYPSPPSSGPSPTSQTGTGGASGSGPVAEGGQEEEEGGGVV